MIEPRERWESFFDQGTLSRSRWRHKCRKNYLYKIEDFEFIDGVFEACLHFQELGYILIIVTNQAGIARGKYTEEDFDILTEWMINEFSKRGIYIAKVYHCPHHPDFTGECLCRKPKPGMLIEAQKEFDIDMKNSILIGDKNSDIAAGIHAGVGRCYLVRTGHEVDENTFNVDILKNLKSKLLLGVTYDL